MFYRSIRGAAYKLFNSYLKGRVKINNIFIEKIDINSLVSRRTVLGKILFIININEFSTNILRLNNFFFC